MKIDLGAPAGMKVTVMGLGLNGGGLATARFFARRGAATIDRPEWPEPRPNPDHCLRVLSKFATA